MSDLWPRIQAEFECDHPDTAVTYKDACNGVRTYRLQCTRCGANVRVVRYAEMAAHQKAAAVPFDEALKRAWWEARNARYSELREAEYEAERRRRRREYDAHIRSAEWSILRSKVMRRAGGVCEGCGDRRPTQVHHLTYERFGREMLFDVAAVCDACHEAIHEGREADGGAA
jgi:hypothetical protein